MKLITRLVSGLGLLALTAAVQAAPITFTFENPGADTPTNAGDYTIGGSCIGITISGSDYCSTDNALGLDYSKDGVSVNVTAASAENTFALMQDLAPRNSGLAVLSAGENNSDDQVQFNKGESILFTFAGPVSLLGLDFNAGADRDCLNPGGEGPCGTFDLFVDGVDQGEFNAIDDLIFGTSFFGTTFNIVAAGPVDGGFAIGSITVDNVSVPEPGSLALLGLGLAGLGFARRKQA